MAHDEGSLRRWPPKKPKGFLPRLLWTFDSWLVNWEPAPHGNECGICKDYFNMDDCGVRPVKPWPDPPPDVEIER